MITGKPSWVITGDIRKYSNHPLSRYDLPLKATPVDLSGCAAARLLGWAGAPILHLATSLCLYNSSSQGKYHQQTI